MKTRIIRFAAASVTALGFVAPGVAGAYGNNIDTTGYDSYNKIEKKVRNDVHIDTDNRVNVRNYNDQYARSGYADVRDNRYVGNVRTGDAANYNETRATVNVTTHNTVPSWGGSNSSDDSIRYTGSDSYNKIEKDVRNNVHIDTDNNVRIQNDNRQVAVSGDATVHNNGSVGNVRTGDAVNENTSYFNVNIETKNN